MEGLPSRIKRVRALGFGGLAQTFSHGKRAVTAIIFGGVRSGVCVVSCGKRSAEEESGFRPSALRGGDGKYYACGGRATKGSFSQRDWRGGHGSEQGHQHDVTVRTPLHEFDDSCSKRDAEEEIGEEEWGREEDALILGLKMKNQRS
ncbi:hypothetical protein Syun_024415 [Stephania yunnanensis]|uniref:Uncharacterized protein n=1 Tax=Stephania yunnanensis TaxID=152371 RepID=A0AAP0I4D5_9MAGN